MLGRAPNGSRSASQPAVSRLLRSTLISLAACSLSGCEQRTDGAVSYTPGAIGPEEQRQLQKLSEIGGSQVLHRSTIVGFLTQQNPVAASRYIDQELAKPDQAQNETLLYARALISEMVFIDTKTAISAWRSVFKTKGNECGAFAAFKLGTMLFVHGSYQEALTAFDHAVNKQSELSDAGKFALFKARGNCRFLLGDIKQAVRDFENMNRVDPGFEGRVLSERPAANLAAAIEGYFGEIAADMKNPSTSLEVVQPRFDEFVRMEAYHQALKDLATFENKNEFPRGNLFAARIYEMLGDFDKSRTAIRRFLDDYPRDRQGLSSLGVSYFRSANYAEAQKVFELCVGDAGAAPIEAAIGNQYIAFCLAATGAGDSPAFHSALAKAKATGIPLQTDVIVHKLP